jgi:hypothetical protein
MKLLLLFLVLVCAPAFAQPQSPANAAREQRAAQQEYLRERPSNYDRERRDEWRHRRWCREWAERHPRERMPRSCWSNRY